VGEENDQLFVYPRGLLERFDGAPVAQVVATLRFLGPLTTTSASTLREARP